MSGSLWWGQDEESGGVVEAALPDAPAAAGATSGGPRGTDPHGLRGRPVLPVTVDRPRATPKRPPPKATPNGTRRPSARPGSERTGKAAPPKPTRRPTAPLPRSRATRLSIGYLDLDAPVMDLRLDRERRLPAPPDDDPNLVGWYADGPSPGEQGTAVAVGHLDTDSGPAVFAGLTELRRGRLVEIRRADGRTAVYAVDAVKSYEKDRFPNDEVYGARGRPELRLITCGGDYDRRTGYSGNVVVFAHLVKIREAPTAPARR
ncbi:class F sortase [Streptomyces sp. NBC_00287]|uniref:class F sortase n=1 Tax=Streptomyces sp. NBC_00287 TaxID=2975702 RepID=UPI002E27D185|nr:class F sortase [Streptomyces sp. NBC_00287]